MGKWSKIIGVATVAGLLLALGVDRPAEAEPKQPCNPCNPCAGKKIKYMRDKSNRQKDLGKLVKLGEKLWTDRSLGKTGVACDTCHAGYNTFRSTVTQPYPHTVEMADDIVTLDQMINVCMVNPMGTEPLAWNSTELSALNAYFTEWIKAYKAPANPCGMKNPCNPCGMKNPCNPRGARKNPCNPCGR